MPAGGPIFWSKYSPISINIPTYPLTNITIYLLRMSELGLQLSDARFMLLLGPCSAMFGLVPLGDPVADCKKRRLWDIFSGCQGLKYSVNCLTTRLRSITRALKRRSSSSLF